MNILISNSFDPDDSVESGYWMVTAETIGKAICCFPLSWHCFVHPALRIETLKSLVSQKKWDIWIHFGHGKGEQGLRDIDQYQEIKKWQNVFQNSSRLPLCIFLCCCSSLVAQCFVERKLSAIAIGFEEPVLVHESQIFVLEMLSEIVRSSLFPQEILHAFESACQRLKSFSFKEGNAKIFLMTEQP